MAHLRLQNRRALSPVKLKRARLAAQMTNVAEVARRLGIDRNAYLHWEDEDRKAPLTHVDYVAMHNALVLFATTYDDITDPLPDPVPA